MYSVAQNIYGKEDELTVLRDANNNQALFRTEEDAQEFISIIQGDDPVPFFPLECGMFECEECGTMWVNHLRDRADCECPRCHKRIYHELDFDEVDIPDHLARAKSGHVKINDGEPPEEENRDMPDFSDFESFMAFLRQLGIN